MKNNKEKNRRFEYKTYEDFVVLTFIRKYAINYNSFFKCEKKVEDKSLFCGKEIFICGMKQEVIYNTYTYTESNIQIVYLKGRFIELYFIESNKKHLIMKLTPAGEISITDGKDVLDPFKDLENYVTNNIDSIVEEHRDYIYYLDNQDKYISDTFLDDPCYGDDYIDVEARGFNDLYEYYYHK